MTHPDPKARARDVLATVMRFGTNDASAWRLVSEEVKREALKEADIYLSALDTAGLAVEQGWRPIEGAPKDGTVVQFIDNTVPEPMAITAHYGQHDAWDEDKSTWLCGTRWPPIWKMTPRIRRAYSEIIGEVMSPTHWRPLPVSPSAAGEGEG